MQEKQCEKGWKKQSKKIVEAYFRNGKARERMNGKRCEKGLKKQSEEIVETPHISDPN